MIRQRELWVGTSWKMTKTVAEALDYVAEVTASPLPEGVIPFLLPAHTSLVSVRAALPPDSPMVLGAQNAHWGPEGPGTGEVSMRMVADAGALIVEMGHSERREQHGETDRTVALKARAAVDAGLVPLVCVGEPAGVRAAGDAEDFVSSQVRAALSELSREEVAGVLIAYEPIWAIGEHGRAATTTEVAPVIAEVARLGAELSGGAGPRALLYGGSVDRRNAAALLREPHVDGLFVGRAAWSAPGFRELLAIAAAEARGA